MTIVFQAKPRPPWRGTRLSELARSGQRAVAARRYVRDHNRALPPDAPILNFFPMLPTRRMHISRILDRLGLRVARSAGPAGVTIAWDAGTRFRRGAADRLPPDAINGRCLDISKSRVDRKWAAVAGYSIEIDPLVTGARRSRPRRRADVGRFRPTFGRPLVIAD